MATALAAGGTIRVTDPATLEVVGEVPAATAADVERALAAARAAQPSWAATPLAERVRALRRLGALVLRHRDELARTVTREMGKPFPEALAAEVFSLLEAVRFVAGAGRSVLEPPRRRLSNLLVMDRTSRVLREPVGVVGIIAPWNYPLAIPGSQTVFALVAGNAVVLKPASATPHVMLRFRDLAREAGVPPDILHVLPGSGGTVGRAMSEAAFDHVIFTGGDAGGRAVERACSARGVACTLELGGSDPAIVLADADLDLAANGILWARFSNAGQTCAAVKRVFVEASVAERLTALLVEKARKLRVGNGLDEDVDVGPLIDAAAVAEMEGYVADAVARGARVLVGGARRVDLRGHFFAPTILADVPAGARVLTEEVFGPILPVVPVRDAEEALARANGTAFGLSASVWTRDRAKARALAARLAAGSVWINDHAYTYALAETPWGGVKASGNGHTHGVDGLLALTRAKHVNEAPSPRLWPNLWWYPYRREDLRTFQLGLPFLYGTGLGRLLAGPRIVAGILRKKLL